MKKIAMIKDGVVENIALWDEGTTWTPSGYELIDVTEIICDLGYLYIDEEFVNPADM